MLTLRPYQEKSIESLRNGFKSGHATQILYMPTGGGKTESAISLLLATASKGNRAAMILDRRILVDQTSARLDKYNIDHGVLMAGHWRWRPHENIQICSAQTLEKCEFLPDLDLIIVDEAHTVREHTKNIIKNLGVMAIGLTASPFTKGLGGIYKNIICDVTTSELVDSGSLVPLKIFVAKEIDMTGAKKIAGEWSQSEATERGIKITGDILSEWVSKTFSFFGKPEKTIIFCAGVAHGEDLQRRFNESGYNFISISYRDDDDYKREVIAEFSKPDSSIIGLIATDVLTKGFDVPDVKIGISARPFSKSLSSHVQQMGRVMRSAYGKSFALWLDHSGNYLRFRDDWDDLYSNGAHVLDDGKEKPKKEPTQKEKESAKCPKCSALWPPKSDTCSNCGYIRQRKNDVQVNCGELVEISGAKKKDEAHTSAYKESFYQQLLRYAKNKGYKDGWAYHKYYSKFKIYPPWAKKEADFVSKEVQNFIISQNIRIAKGRRYA
jgi:DNA repair protein RadD